MAKIDLGSKVEPMGPMAFEKSVAGKETPKVSYPSMYVHKTGDEGFDSVPDGDFHFHGKGKVVSRGVEERDGKKHHNMEMEVHHIEPMDNADGESEGGLEKEIAKIASKKIVKKQPKGESTE